MNSFEYKINKATIGDIEVHLYNCAKIFSPPLDTYFDIPKYAKKIRLNSLTVEAWSENELIGLSACYLNNEETLKGHITNLSVIEDHQNKRIATKLIDLTFQEALKMGFRTISLEVEVENSKAIALYKKRGFVLSGRVGSKYRMQNELLDNSDVLVSICCITYNHASYISEAIEGFLKQKTTFSFEVLIHDDASTDNTATIIREYEAQYPNIIKPIYQSENQYSKGVIISTVYQFPRAKGKYIAMCEGDDYWTDPYKLQKQVDYLEDNEKTSGCATQSRVVYSSEEKETHIFREKFSSILSFEDLLDGRKFHTASFVFRKALLNKIPLPINIAAEDLALFLLCALFGPIYFFEESMSIYRKSNTGVSSWISYEMISNDLEIARWIKSISPTSKLRKLKKYLHYSCFSFPRKLPILLVFYHFLFYLYYSIPDLIKDWKSTAKIAFFSIPRIIMTQIKH